MHPLILSASPEELEFIAGLDYGQDMNVHLDALQEVIETHQGRFLQKHIWAPYEVVELGASSLRTGHEREFTICTLWLIGSVRNGFDTHTDLNEKFDQLASEYDRLPEHLRALVLEAYTANQALQRTPAAPLT